MTTKTRLLSIFPQNLSQTGTPGEVALTPDSLSITTDAVTEGTNLYYTTSRANADFDTRLATKSTSNLTEGTNLYYTSTRANADFDTRLATKSTTNLAEGTNLYYTDSRVASYLTSNSYATQAYVGTQLANLVDSSPATLDTLNELAAALGDDPNFATTTATAIGLKAPLASPTFTGVVETNDQFKSVGGGGDLRVNGNFNNNQAAIGTTGSNSLMLMTANTGRLFISDSGYVGVVSALSDISERFTVKGDQAGIELYNTSHSTRGNIIRFLDTGWQAAIYHNSGSLVFRTGGATSTQNRLAIDTAGYVSISGNLTINSGTADQFRLLSPSTTQSLWVRAGYDTDGSATPISSLYNVQFQSSGNAGGTFTFVTGNTKTLAINGGAVEVFGGLTATNSVISSARFTLGSGPVTATDNYLRLEGNYFNGQYAHRLRKEDLGGGVPLFIDSSGSTANSYSALARFGTYSGNSNTFEVFGNAKINGDLKFTGNGSTLSGHFYTETHDGSNVYFHVGTATSTSKILNLRVFRSDNTVGTHYFYPDAANLSGTVSATSFNTSTFNTAGGVTLGPRVNSTNFGGNTGGLTGHFVAEVRSATNRPSLTFHYENVATRHIQLTSDGTVAVVSPSSENSGLAHFQVNGVTTVYGTSQTTDYWVNSGYSGGSINLAGSNNAYGAGGAVQFSALNDSGTTTPQWVIKSYLTNGGVYGVGRLTISGRNSTSDTNLTKFIDINNVGMAEFTSWGANGINLGTDKGANGNSGRLFFTSGTSSFSIVNTINELSFQSEASPGSDTGSTRMRFNATRTQIGRTNIYSGDMGGDTYTHTDSFHGTQTRTNYSQTSQIVPGRQVGGASFTTPYVIEFRTPNNESNSANTYYPVSFSSPSAGSGGTLGNLWVTRKYWDEGPYQRGNASIGWTGNGTHQGGLDLCMRIAESAWSDKYEMQVLWYRYSYHQIVSDFGMHPANTDGTGPFWMLLRGGFYYRIFADFPIAVANVTPGGIAYSGQSWVWPGTTTTVNRTILQNHYSIGSN